MLTLLIRRSSWVSEVRQNPPQSAKAATEDRFQVTDPRKSGRVAIDVKTQRSERSQEVVENKGKCFSHSDQSQEVYENKGFIFVKPRGY